MSEYCKLEILQWSATDYSFLINNHLGYVSDDFRYYCFFNTEDMTTMKKYLDLKNERTN